MGGELKIFFVLSLNETLQNELPLSTTLYICKIENYRDFITSYETTTVTVHLNASSFSKDKDCTEEEVGDVRTIEMGVFIITKKDRVD